MPRKRKVNLKKFDKAMRPGEKAAGGLAWHSPKERPFHLAGFAWFDTDRVYRRMPLQPPHPLPKAVDDLANWTAGGQVRFRTDSPKVAVRVSLTDKADMNHMPATGQCGFDCYVGPPKKMRFVGVTKYDHHKTRYEHVLFDHVARQTRNFVLNFPLYMGVRKVLVGLEEGSKVLPPPAVDAGGPVVIYGTSITQGGCASRPGMAYPNILSRRLNVEVINLGFSGSGRGEPEVARVITEIPNPAMFVLDYEGNAGETELLRKTYPEFIRILREVHPHVPILAVSRIAWARDLLSGQALQTRLERKRLQQEAVRKLRKAGDRNIFFVDGSTFLGEDFDECTVDGGHPTDLGFLRIADALEPVIRKILQKGTVLRC